MLGPRRTQRKWTPSEDEELLRLAAQNFPHYRIAHALGRTGGAVNSRLKVLRSRPAPDSVPDTQIQIDTRVSCRSVVFDAVPQ
jgi:hypothetical protein